MPRLFLLGAALGSFLAVALGAFGAHALQGMGGTAEEVTRAMGTWTKAVQYQFHPSLALLGIGVWMLQRPDLARPLGVAGGWFLAGLLLFCGSLYLLVLSGQRWLGAVTPFGGTAFLIGWAALARAAWLTRPRSG